MSKDVAVFAKGVKLEVSDMEVSPTFTEVKGITNYTPDPGGAGEPERLQCTSGSTVGLVREYKDGYSDKRPAAVALEMFFDGANEQHLQMRAAAESGDYLDYRITIPTSTGNIQATFSARINGFPIDIPYDKLVSLKPTLAVQEDSWEWAA